MTINPEHLFDQAERLIEPPQAGAPRQVNLRRAISSAYYGVFHGILAVAADQFVGSARRGTWRYDLVYRKIDHGQLRKLCAQVNQSERNIEPYAPPNGFDRGIKDFARGLLELQQKRHSADYNPSYKVRSADAAALIKSARSTLNHFNGADAEQRSDFLALLLFPPR